MGKYTKPAEQTESSPGSPVSGKSSGVLGKYTIEDVARELGINKSTVSRAISGKGRVGEETRAKVLAFIEEHDYHPNAVAKSLAQNRTCNLGLVLPGDYSSIQPAFFHEFMEGCCEIAAEHDYDVMVSMIKDQDLSQLERMVRNQKVDGILVSWSTLESRVTDMLKKKNVPHVVAGRSPHWDVPCVDNDNEGASREMTHMLLSRGLKNLVLLGGNDRDYVTHCRQRGYETAHAQAGIPIRPEQIFLNINDAKKAASALETALRMKADGIICMDDYICILALTYLREKGIAIPDDVQIASFYDSLILKQYTPSVTSLHFDAKELGRIACKILLERLDGQETSYSSRIGYQLIVRESTR